MTFSIMTFRIMTFSIKGLYVTLCITIHCHYTPWLYAVSRFIHYYAEHHYVDYHNAECHYTDCHGALFGAIEFLRSVATQDSTQVSNMHNFIDRYDKKVPQHSTIDINAEFSIMTLGVTIEYHYDGCLCWVWLFPILCWMPFLLSVIMLSVVAPIRTFRSSNLKPKHCQGTACIDYFTVI